MKKVLTITLLAALAIPAFARKKKEPFLSPSFTMRVGLNYAFPIAGSEAMVYASNLQPINGSQSYDGIYNTYNLNKASFSAGLGLAIAPCFMLNEHLGIEIGANLGISMKKYTLDYTSTDPANTFNGSFTSNAKLPVVLTPAIVVSTGDNTRLSGYARAGLALPVSGKIVTTTNYTDTSNFRETDVFEVKSRISIGVCGAAGVRYKLNNFTSLWLELNGMALSLNPKTGQFTSIVQDGSQVLNQVNYNDTHYEYTGNFAERNNSNQNVATKATPIATPFSNLGIGIGISMHL